MAWKTFRSVLSGAPAAQDDQVPVPPREAGAAPRQSATTPKQPLALDAIGQRDEVVRQRISVMLDRLDHLRGLRDDFSAILEPLVQISDELPRSSMRIAELETSLAQERQAHGGVRQDLSDLQLKVATLSNELSDAVARADKAEDDLIDRERTIAEQAITLRDKLLAIENLERQLFGESEQNKALTGENKALRLEAQAADSALSRSEHELLTARERLAILDQDSRKLQILSEEQSAHLAELTARHKDLEATADANRQKLRAVEAELLAETEARQRAEAQYEVELGSYKTERAALGMKLEAAENRAATNEQLLSQTRNLLREKDEAHRIAERNLKEASIARATAERRVEALQADLQRQTERFQEMQRVRTELDGRTVMLNKALAAKDSALEQAVIRNTSLTDRIAELTRKHESARNELELGIRRLTEDLENERSERTLLQGALDIARETRVALQKQHEALKRSGRTWRDEATDTNQDGDTVEGSSNVRPFAPPNKPA